MLTYATVGANDIEQAKAFYDSLLSSIGIDGLFDHPTGGRFYGKAGKLMFGVLRPFDGKAATVGNGAMWGFELDSREQVDAFHTKAIALGGTTDGDPGLRGPEEMGAYFSYFRDPEGNKICAYRIG